MSLIGLQIYLALKFSFLITKKNISIVSLLIGFSLPESGSFLILLNNLLTDSKNKIYLLDKDSTHSLITIGIIYLLFLIIYEIKKRKSILRAANGIVIGMLINITIDIFLRLGNINIFWPLPIITLSNYDYHSTLFNTFLILEFIFFRLAYYQLIEITLKKAKSNKHLKYLSYWMKILNLFLFIFIITIFIFSNNILAIFNLLYIISYSGLLFSIFLVKEVIE
jgi:hypothetical protein